MKSADNTICRLVLLFIERRPGNNNNYHYYFTYYYYYYSGFKFRLLRYRSNSKARLASLLITAAIPLYFHIQVLVCVHYAITAATMKLNFLDILLSRLKGGMSERVGKSEE